LRKALGNDGVIALRGDELSHAVTENVYDTATGRYLLIPQGSRLVGQYDSQIAFGQRRILLVWTRLILPDASSISLDRLPGVDTSGYAGLQDDVDWHWQQLLARTAHAHRSARVPSTRDLEQRSRAATVSAVVLREDRAVTHESSELRQCGTVFKINNTPGA
jgi:hypothetical protein